MFAGSACLPTRVTKQFNLIELPESLCAPEVNDKQPASCSSRAGELARDNICIAKSLHRLPLRKASEQVFADPNWARRNQIKSSSEPKYSRTSELNILQKVSGGLAPRSFGAHIYKNAIEINK